MASNELVEELRRRLYVDKEQLDYMALTDDEQAAVDVLLAETRDRGV